MHSDVMLVVPEFLGSQHKQVCCFVNKKQRKLPSCHRVRACVRLLAKSSDQLSDFAERIVPLSRSVWSWPQHR